MTHRTETPAASQDSKLPVSSVPSPPNRRAGSRRAARRSPRADVDYAAHPFLDPDLFRRDRSALRYFIRLFRDYARNDWQYKRLLEGLLHTAASDHSIHADERILSSYFADADLYLRELLQMVPDGLGDVCAPDPEVADCQDLRCLGKFVFSHDGADPKRARRLRFEAQRKLYLTKLLIQIAYTRTVQDGPRHRQYLNDLLERELWAYVVETRDERAPYTPESSKDQSRSAEREDWHFRVRRVVRDIPGSRADLEIHHFDTRFKKQSAGYDYAPGRAAYEVSESPRYGRMKRGHSASILSKMLRKGINNPSAITDMLGAKFIVETERDVRRLADLLHQVLGGLFMFRNQVDLFRHPEHHDRLNSFSAREFRAFKEDVDILYPGQPHEASYLFSAELQILTRESFLQTVHSRAYASHREYKRRQFLQGVMPYVFPDSVYGRPISEMVPLGVDEP
jgi:hypothetical protein